MIKGCIEILILFYTHGSMNFDIKSYLKDSASHSNQALESRLSVFKVDEIHHQQVLNYLFNYSFFFMWTVD